MKAKDTVMPEEGRVILSYMNPEIIEATLTELLNKQAEISFKAGHEQKCAEVCMHALKEVKKQGIKEVVDFMREIGVIGFAFDVCTEEEEKEQRLKWSLQLKKWEL